MAYYTLRIADLNSNTKGFKTVTLEEGFINTSSAVARIEAIKENPKLGIYLSSDITGNSWDTDTSKYNIKLESWSITEKQQVTSTEGATTFIPHVILKYTLKLADFWTN